MQEQIVSGGCNTATQLVQTSERLMQLYDCIANCEVAAIVSCFDSVAESVTTVVYWYRLLLYRVVIYHFVVHLGKNKTVRTTFLSSLLVQLPKHKIILNSKTH